MIASLSASTSALSASAFSRTQSVGSTQSQPAQSAGKDADAQKIITRLAETDRKVRTHEAAHLAAAGGLAEGGVHFTYQRGPDGKLYAVGGDVSIDTSTGRTPSDTLARAERIRAAALAPADPSAQDYKVAAEASGMEAEARLELARQQGQSGSKDGSTTNADAPAHDVRNAYRSQQDALGRLLDISA